jgi:hypothetical protein
MKTVLKISILLNMTLLGGLIFVAVDGRKPISRPILVMAENKPQTMDAVRTEHQASSGMKPAPFSWSQLESADYHTYIKNLRGIGCPEPTVQAIVAADVRNHYNAKYQELEQKLKALDDAPLSKRLASYNDRQALVAELQKLPGEEASMSADLQAVQTASTQAAARTMAGIQSREEPVLPLVFQNVDLAKLNLNGRQIKLVSNLREEFVDAIGGLNQNPNDPAYLQHWQIAQPEMDRTTMGMFGFTAFMNYQLEAGSPQVTY